jgi:hypothetical protein
MATQVQFRGGTTVEHSTFTGAAREITIDTDKDTVVVHDGTTAGGYPLATEDGATLTNVDINSGTIDGTTIGATTPSTVSATDLTATGTTTLAGADTSADITFGDNVKATFGIGSDLQIYHDGSNSYISEQGTGDLRLRADNLHFADANGTTSFYAVADGAVYLYYDGSTKLTTTSTGVDITGTLGIDGLTVDGDATIQANKNETLQLKSTNALTTGWVGGDVSVGRIEWYGSSSAGNGEGIKAAIDTAATTSTGRDFDLLFKTGVNVGSGEPTTSLSIAPNGDISFYEDTGTTPKFFWDASAESLGIGTSSPQAKAEISGGLNNRLRINSTDGTTSNNYGIDFSTAGTVRAGIRYNAGNNYLGFYGYDNTERLRINSSGNVGIGTSSPADVLHVKGEGQITVEDTSSGNIGEVYVSNTALQLSVDPSGSIASSGIVMRVDGLEKMRIDDSGNVGIGTSSPARQLHVDGSEARLVRLSHTSHPKLEFLDTTDGTSGAYIGSEDNELTFDTNGQNERMRIDSSGNVGIGTSSPQNILHLADSGSSSVRLQITNSVSGETSSDGFAAILSSSDIIFNNQEAGAMRFATNNSEAARIDSGGNLHVGFQSYASLGTVNTGVRLSSDSTTNAIARGSNGSLLRFYSGSGPAGNISVSGASTSYNTSSDYRLKENVETLSGAITRVKTLKPKRFSWIEDGLDSPNIDGFIAHEAQAVVPEAVTGTHNETQAIGDITDGDGNTVETGVVEPDTLEEGHTWTETGTQPVYQGIDQSKLVPLLTAALQEAIAKIETLETEMTSVKSRLDALEA